MFAQPQKPNTAHRGVNSTKYGGFILGIPRHICVSQELVRESPRIRLEYIQTRQ
jgi:hypothetical protein